MRLRRTNPAPRPADGRPAASMTLLGSIGYIFSLWRHQWLRALLILLLMTLYLLYKTYFALVGKTMIDSLQATGQVAQFGRLLVLLGLGFLVAFGARYWAERMIAQLSVTIINQLRLRMFTHLQALSQRFYARTPVGNIMARFAGDLADIERSASTKLRDGVLDWLEIAYNFPFLFYLEWRLACLAFLLLCLMIFFLGKLITPATTSGYQLKRSEAKLMTQLQENVHAQAVIRAFGLEQQRLDLFEAQLRTLIAEGTLASFLRTQVSLGAKAYIMAFRVILTIIGALLITQGSLTVGALIAFLALLELITSSVDNSMRNVLPDLIATTASIQRVEELLQEQPDSVDRADALTLPPLQEAISVRNLSFRYTDKESTLHALDLTIAAGTNVAFVGPSGSGKSTLLGLLMRAYDATSGSIAFDGVDLRQSLRRSLQQQMSVVFQETYLFDTTIRENIRMAKATATDAEVEQAARLAEIHDLIMTLPQQYDTPVGEAGGWLSGGQRQRIAIARAIIRNPTILLLDEATSALDPGTEAAVNATIQRLSKARTVIAVTHRLASVVEADCIFVLQAGRLVQAGKHQDLVQQEGLYAQLWQKQNSFAVSADGRQATVQAAYLRHITLFADLDLATLATLASRFSPEYVAEGQTVMEQGAMGDRLYLIARGRVEVLVRTKADTTDVTVTVQRIDTMQDGDHFGEMALLSDAPRNATIRTLTACLFLTLPKAEFLTLVQTLPAVRAAVDAQIERNRANRARLIADGQAV